MAKAEKLASGNWRCRAYYTNENGKSVSKSFTAPTKKEAQYQASAFKMEKKRKKNPDNITLGEAIDSFIENRSEILSPTTITAYKSLRKHAYGAIIDTRLGLLTKETLQVTINKYAAQHAPKSVKNAFGLLAAVVKVKYPNLDTNIKLPQKKKIEKQIPSTEELNLVIESAKGTPLYVPILFAALLGLRRGEICALTWEDIDLEKNVVRINKAVVWDEYNSLVVKTPKTYSSNRVLRMPTKLKEALPPRGEPIVTLTPNQLSDSFVNLVKRLNIPHFTFHDLRHYNASVMLGLNIPDKYAMERTGHSTPNMLKTTYQHTFPAEQEVIAEKMDKFFNENLG